MSDGLESLEAAAQDFRREADFDFVDPKRLAAVIDGLQGDLCKVLDRGRKRGDYQLARLSPASWAARTCGMSRHSAADRLCVGKHLDSMPETSAALVNGEIGYQAASALDPMLDGMHSVDGVLDPVTGAAFRTALDSLAVWRGPEDTRNHGQRMADALAELLDHHLNEGRLPRRKGVRPHVTLAMRSTVLPE